MRVRVVVADRGEVRFYDATRPDSSLDLVGRLTDSAAHLHERDFKSDRPGRVFDHAPGQGRRGATAHHSTGGERTPRKHEAEAFARQIAGELEKAYRRNEFDRVVLMAGPPFLGLLRDVIPDALRESIVAEVGKDLVHQDDRAVAAHLPPGAFDSRRDAGSP